MHPRTEATIEQLKRVEWFCNVGVRDTTAADVLSSWDEAIESCSSLEWENLCLEAVNQYRERVFEKSPSEAEKWNEVVRDVRPAAQSLVREKIKVIEETSLPQVVIDAMDWDIVGLCMESEYADVYRPGFFASLAYWYSKGHYPCGWRGEFPEGRLVIY